MTLSNFISIFAVAVLGLVVFSHLRMIVSYPKTAEPMRGEDIAIRIGLLGFFLTTEVLLVLWTMDVPRTVMFMFIFQGVYSISGMSLAVGFLMTVKRMKEHQVPWLQQHRFSHNHHTKSKEG